MNLQRELRHKSEDIHDLVLLDVVKALRRRVRKISHDYDVPYIAGYSEDGKTVFIDRHLPRSFRWQRWSRFLRRPGRVDSPIQRTNHHEDAETIFG
jgi:hypothetical protein